MLDARVPPGGWKEEERIREELIERRISDLLDETRLWRPANSAQWVAWGIVQAKVPELEGKAPSAEGKDGHTAAGGEEGTEEESGADEFDYLGYANDRVMFFWGDCVRMGLIKLEELPEDLRPRLKLVEY
jgi:choline kinase